MGKSCRVKNCRGALSGNIPLTVRPHAGPVNSRVRRRKRGPSPAWLRRCQSAAWRQTAAHGQFIHGRPVRAASAAKADGHDREQPREHDDCRLQGRASGDARPDGEARNGFRLAQRDLVCGCVDAPARLFNRPDRADRQPAGLRHRGRRLLRGADGGGPGLYARRSLHPEPAGPGGDAQWRPCHGRRRR